MRLNGVSESEAKVANGCNGAHEQGLRILIVGAGIGGLTAAIALRKQGHRVLVMAGPESRQARC
jgi:monoamine oxidase